MQREIGGAALRSYGLDHRRRPWNGAWTEDSYLAVKAVDGGWRQCGADVDNALFQHVTRIDRTTPSCGAPTLPATPKVLAIWIIFLFLEHVSVGFWGRIKIDRGNAHRRGPAGV